MGSEDSLKWDAKISLVINEQNKTTPILRSLEGPIWQHYGSHQESFPKMILSKVQDVKSTNRA